MKIHHHIVRKFHESTQAPLWKWLVIIFLVIAIPLFYSFVRMTQIQQVFGGGQGVVETNAVNPT